MAGSNLSKRMQTISRKVNGFYETFFYWWGCTVATNPYKVILATLLLTGLCSIGLLNFTSGTNCIKIGLPGKLILSKRKCLYEVLFS